MDQDNALQTEVQRDVAANVVQNDVNPENVVENVVAGNVEKEVRTTSVPMFPVLNAVQGPPQALRSVIVGPSTTADPIITVVPSFLKKVLNFIPSKPSPIFLRHLTLLDISHEIIIPSYFNDDLILGHLAFILRPQLGG